VSCTVDTCEPATGCVSEPEDALCDNGEFCDGIEICDAALDCLSGIEPCSGECDEDGDMCVGGELVELFWDDFAGGLGQWTHEGWWVRFNTEALHSSAGYPGSGSGSPALHADNCRWWGCTISLATGIDLSGYSSASLEFLRFVDQSLDSGEYLRLQVSVDGGAWTTVADFVGEVHDDDVWHAEAVDLAPYLGASDFRIRFTTRQNATDEHVHVDDVRIIAQ
jgi:hypothetical protein